MTIEREIFGWKFAAAGAAGDLAASCSVLRAARAETQWTRRLNGPEDSMDPKAEWTRTRRMKRSEMRSAASHSATAREDARKMQFRLHSGY